VRAGEAPANEPENLLTYSGYAYLRGGSRAAVSAALAVLYAEGLVQAVDGVHNGVHNGMIYRTEKWPEPTDALELAICRALYQPAGPWVLAARPPVQRALKDVRARLGRAGLRPRWWLPRRTAAGARRLSAAEMRCSNPALEPPNRKLTPAEIGLTVALYGGSALLVLMPRFAHDGGLLTHHSPTDVKWDHLDPKPGTII
jgi:hypothetical protein